MIELNFAVEVLAALAHEVRLGMIRILVRVGPDGLSAGQLAKRVGISPTAASFHFNHLRTVGLVQRHRVGSQLVYSANFRMVRELRDFLDMECCAEDLTGCAPECGANADQSTTKPQGALRQEMLKT